MTHVCKFWRQAGINAPDLWAKIYVKNLEVVKVFLERSGAVPLSVDFHWGIDQEEYYDLLEAVVPHAHRFLQLSVHPPGGDPNPFAPFTKAAPLLEKLDITCPVELQQSFLFNDQAPLLRELVVYARNLWFQNRFGNLTSLHLTLSDHIYSRSEFPPFFDVLRRCPALEEMFVWWITRDVALATASIQVPPIPLRHLRKLTLHSFCVENIRYLFHLFEFGENEVAVHLREVEFAHDEVPSVSIVQTIFANDNFRRLSLASPTKLELIFNTQSQTFILHAVGPNSSVRIDMCLEVDAFYELTFQDVFSSVKELWVRGTPDWDARLDGLEHLVALEKLVLSGRGSRLAQNLQEALSSGSSGTLPCPLLSVIDCYGGEPEMREVFLLARARFNAGYPLERLRIPSSFVPPPVDVSACVGDVTSLDPPAMPLNVHSMELPEYCFAKDHEWWRTWGWRV